MRSDADAAFLTHIDQGTTSISVRWKVTRQDGTVVGFTSHVSDVTLDGVTYRAATGATPSAVASSADLSVDNLDVIALLDDSTVTDSELLAGLYDYADIEIGEFNHRTLDDGGIIRAGTLGEHSVGASFVKVELRGILQPLQQVIGRIHQKRCDADLYDSRCKLERQYFNQQGAVTSVTSRGLFAVSGLSGADGWFNNGRLDWLTGANAGLSMEVKNWTLSPDTVELFLPMPFDIEIGDTFDLAPGCDLLISTCRDKFNNVVNFRGFPYMPTRDAVLEYPDAPG